MSQELSSQTFHSKVLEASKPVVIDFYAAWCGPCKMMAPHFEELSQELGEQFDFYAVNIDNESELAIQHNVMSIPTLVLYKNGKQVAWDGGYKTKEELKAFILENLS